MAGTPELDDLMNLDPLDMTSEDIAGIIQYHRNARARMESGVKGSKPTKESGPKVSLGSVLDKLVKPKPIVTVKRRV